MDAEPERVPRRLMLGKHNQRPAVGGHILHADISDPDAANPLEQQHR